MDHNALIIILFVFSILGFILCAYLYKGIRKQEKEGVDLAASSKSMIPLMAFGVLIIIFCFLYIIGLLPHS